MSVAFSAGIPDTALPASANMADADDAYRMVTIDNNGLVIRTAASTNRVVGVTRGPAVHKDAGYMINVRQFGRVTVRAHAAFAAGASLAPAADGRVASKASAATDRCIALEAAGAADDLVQAVLLV